MEEQKVRYYEKFRKRIPEEILKEFKSFLQREKTRIHSRYCYVSRVCPLQMDEFEKMILYDSIFIVELLLGYHDEVNDGFLNKSLVKDNLIRRDLLLLENQIPYFILEKLYGLLLGYQTCYPSLLNLSCKFFSLRVPKEKKEFGQETIKHFTDLARSSLVGIFPRDLESSSRELRHLLSAKELKKLGVKFESITGGCIGDMKCISIKFLIVWLLKFQIPHVEVNMLSECMFQNVRALELCAYDVECCHDNNFLSLMGSLVQNEEDLNLLVTNKIISNNLGDEADVLNLFKRVSQGSLAPKLYVWSLCGRLCAPLNF